MHTSIQCSNGPPKKPDVCNGPVVCSAAAMSQSQFSSLHSDTGKMMVPDEESIISQESLEPVEKESNADGRTTFSESSFTSVHPATLPVNRQPHGPPTTKLPPNSTNFVDSSLVSSGLASDKNSVDATDGNMENICSDILSMGIHENQILENGYVQPIREPVTSRTSGTTANSSEEVGFRDVQSGFRLGMPSQVTQIDLHETEDDLLSFDNQRLKDPEVATNRVPDFSHAASLSRPSNIGSPPFSKADGSISIHLDRQVVDNNSNFHIGHSENTLKIPEVNDIEYLNLLHSKEKRSLLGRYEGELGSGAFDMGESSIISNILSIDFDPWDESLTSPQNLSKLLGENDKQQGSFGVPGSRKIQNCNQSRFSFAREEEPMSQVSGFGQSIDYFAKGSKQRPLGHEFSNSNGLHLEKFDSPNGFPVFNGTESDIFTGNHSHISSNRFSGKLS